MDEIEQRELMGKRIRQAREALNLSQHDLAIRIERNQYAVSEYENGKRRIYAHDLPRLAQALNVTINYFFMPYEGDSAEGLDNDTQQLEEHMLVHFRRLPSTIAKQFVTNFVQQLNSVIEPDNDK